MTATQRKKLLKVKTEIDSMFAGDIKRFGFTPYMIDIVLDMYGNLVNEQPAETICEEVKNYFEKRKFVVTAKGIGWTNTLTIISYRKRSQDGALGKS